YLDLVGRIPRVAEVHDFLDDKAPDKRARLVDRLLESPQFVVHFSNVWRAMLLPQNNNPQVQAFAGQLERWLRGRFRDNTPYDQLVRELLTTPVTSNQPQGRQPGARPLANPNEPTALAFYQANELKPENLAASTSRIFLGFKLECAQCHDHPFARWRRQQFWEYAAFFSGIGPAQPNNPFQPAPETPTRKEIDIPGAGKKVTARFLDGSDPAWKDDVPVRTTLADWVVSGDNPYFAR